MLQSSAKDYPGRESSVFESARLSSNKCEEGVNKDVGEKVRVGI